MYKENSLYAVTSDLSSGVSMTSHEKMLREG